MASKGIVLKFYADWCGPCKVMSPVLSQVYDELFSENNDVQLIEVNIDSDPDTARAYGIMGVPTIIATDENGVEIDRLVGGQPEEAIRSFLRSAVTT